MNIFYKTVFFITLYLSYFSVNAGFTFCDSGDILFNSNDINQICNGGNVTTSFTGEIEFSGNYVNNISGYLGNNNNILFNDTNLNYELPIGIFDTKKNTVVNNIYPEYTNHIGFIGNKNEILYQNTQSIKAVTGFFGNNISTIINNNNPEFIFSVGIIDILENKYENVNDYKSENIKDFYLSLFNNYSNNNYIELGYSKEEYEEFLDKLVELLIDNGYDNYKGIISKQDTIRIYKNMDKNNFSQKINNLLLELETISNSINISNNDYEKLYLIKHYY